MTDILKLLEKDEQLIYMKNSLSEYDDITKDNDIEKRIAELNATNTLLISVTDELDKQKLEHQMSILNLKNSEEYINKYKTLKQREEQAIIENDDYNFKILSLTNKQRILQAHRTGLEYEIRLLFKKLEQNGDSI